mgnify:FL=1
MLDLDERIMEEIRTHALLKEGDRVLVGVSGGPDSMMLLHWLYRQRRRWQLTVMAAHLNHQFRGEEADKDQQFVEQTCQALGIVCFTTKMDVARYAREKNLSKQAAARACRYAYFERLAREQHIDKLALAHHADDQIETVLMRLIRGAGLRGISGMPVKRSAAQYEIIRPLMALSKEEIEAYIRHFGINARVDQSNFSADYTRNRIRLHLVPEMKTLNPNLHRAVHELTAVLREENELLEEKAQVLAEKVIKNKTGNTITINLPLLEPIAPALQRRIILLILNYLPVRSHEWQKIHIDSILHMCRANKSYARIDLPEEVCVIREYEQLRFTVGKEEAAGVAAAEIDISRAGRYTFGQWMITVEYLAYESSLLERMNVEDKKQQGAAETYFDARLLSFPLFVRRKQPGAKMQPFGMNGHRKVKDIFIDAKIPRSKREGWPIVSDREDIIWIPGLKRADKAKLSAETQRVLHIRVEPREGLLHERGHQGDTDYRGTITGEN